MTTRDHTHLTVEDFRGLIDNGQEETTPQGSFISSQNNVFRRRGIKTRGGLDLFHTIPNIRRMRIYKIEGQAPRLLILDNQGKIYDSTSIATAILTIPTMTDFSSVTIFGRAYITPHNGVKGLPGEKIYVYNGAGLARPAGGTKPTGYVLTLSQGGAGPLDAGLKVIGVMYETATGFLTGIGAQKSMTFEGNKVINVGSIDFGPPGTIARVLVSTKSILAFNGDLENQIFYEIPNGRIPDNTTTAKTVSFYDADLVNEVTDHSERMETIPAGVGIGLYNGRMITWGSDQYASLVYVSEPGEPEAVNSVEGFVTINPSDAGFGLKNCWEHRGQLVCQKSQRSYNTLDNGERAAYWPVTLLDASVGTEPHGVGGVLDFGHIIEDVVIIAHVTGLRTYNGVFATMPLTHSISDIWDRINKKYFHTVEVAVNTIDAEIFVVVPLDGATAPSHVLYGDYNDGLSSEAIKWDVWKFPSAPQTVVVDLKDENDEAVPTFGMYTGNIYRIDDNRHNDFGNAIDAWHEHALLPFDSGAYFHATGVNLKVRGVGTLFVTVRGLDEVDAITTQNIEMTMQKRKPAFLGFNFTAYRTAVKFRVDEFDDWYEINKYELLVSQVWE